MLSVCCCDEKRREDGMAPCVVQDPLPASLTDSESTGDIPCFYLPPEVVDESLEKARSCTEEDATKLIVSVSKTPACSDLGLVIRQFSNRLVVAGVGPGLISNWNEKHPERAVTNNCQLIEVNGLRGVHGDELVQRIKRLDNLRLTFDVGCKSVSV
uniref:Uncharacterized protein n=1 Tax=Noctiluca scintillans TaxID=2966 RepID=A0A7S0ZVU0_NOCSC